MAGQDKVFVFGEVLFDCFSDGHQILGGAPFNVAWHLQALGDRPDFISRVGDDALGRKILAAMRRWQMSAAHVQVDPKHPTGRVEVSVVDHEPHYRIKPDAAYDYISIDLLPPITGHGILYHGTLGLRNEVSRKAFTQLIHSPELSVFLDVNLRAPWWKQHEVHHWVEKARWIKLNEEEIRLLGFESVNQREALSRLQSQFGTEQVILTRGKKGALVRNRDGSFYEVEPEPSESFVDSVGAGDAFTALYIHGLLNDWTIPDTLEKAQQFASQIVTLRGALSTDPAFYQNFMQRFL